MMNPISVIPLGVMNLERKIAALFKMDDKTWERHVNPWSVWTRMMILPVLALVIWSRVWLGWYRLHVPLTSSPRVEYKVGHKKFHMKIGRVYDFNNRWRHSVRHKGKRPRINLFIDYYPNPGLYVPPPYGHL